MQPERWLRIEEIIQSAIDCEPSVRLALLDTACGGDPELRKEVESLLAVCDDGSLATTSAFGEGMKVLEWLGEKVNEGRRIGPYRVLKEIGRGGMGTVYLAARADEAFQKLVAIKIIRRGLDTDDIIQRFRNERQILATLDHPNVARLLDGGTTADGLPYFVMEYIEGEPIDAYCNTRGLNLAERLKIFQFVCAAVSYAHRNLIVHRDIKPGNVLVIKEGVPRLLDFGIAKLLVPGISAGERTLTAKRALTPEYASPEQIRGENITTASDVYSLGVLLYKLLTGKMPYRLADRIPTEMERVICAEEPERPSLAADPLPGRRLRGDVDNIVLMALRKEPQRRYGSVEQFSEDLRRHLEGLPVIARPDTVGYRTTKFLARHKAGVIAATLLVLTLSVGIVATAWQARVVRLETAKAQRINSFLQGILGFADRGWWSSNAVKNPDAKISDAVELAASRAETELADQPEVQAEMRFTIGKVYIGLGRLKQAEQILRPALETQIRLYGPNHREVALTAYMLAYTLGEEGNLAESESLFRTALDTFRKEAQSGHPDMFGLVGSLINFGMLLDEKAGDANAAESYYREALQYAPKLTGKDRAMVGVLDSALAGLRYKRGDLDEAERLERASIGEYRKLPAGNYIELAVSLGSLGTVLTRKGRFTEAEPLIREALEIDRKLLGEMHSGTAGRLNALADLLYSKGDYGAAEDAANKALHIYDQTLPKGNITATSPLLQLGLILNRTGRSRLAEGRLREVLAIRTRVLARGHQNIANAEGALGECLTTEKRFAEAEPFLLRSYAETKDNLGEQDSRTIGAHQRLKILYEAWHKPPKSHSF